MTVNMINPRHFCVSSAKPITQVEQILNVAKWNSTKSNDSVQF